MCSCLHTDTTWSLRRPVRVPGVVRDASKMAMWHAMGVAILLVAVAGGHLEELWHMKDRLVPADDEVLWVTTDTAQSRSLLAGEQRLFAPSARPRDAAAAISTSRFARHVLALADWRAVVSTGALIAVPFLTLARARGTPSHFLESAARATGPSLSGRIVERIPGIQCYSPYPRWSRPPWVYRGSVFDGFAPAPPVAPRLEKVVVTVGTSTYGFGRLFERLIDVLPAGCEVVWQAGGTDLSLLVGRRNDHACHYLSVSELAQAMVDADLVVCHGGVGSALRALEAGRAPLLVPRRARYGEHVDDHQVEISRELAGRGLATSSDVEGIDLLTLRSAAAKRVTLVGAPPPFFLEPASSESDAVGGARASA